MEKGGFFPEGALGGQGTDGGAAHRAIEGFTEIGADGVIFRGPVVGTRPQFDPHGGCDVGQARSSGAGKMKKQGLGILRIDLQGPVRGAAEQPAEGFPEAGEKPFADAVLTCELERLDAPGLLLARGGLGIVLLAKAQELTVDGDVHVL